MTTARVPTTQITYSQIVQVIGHGIFTTPFLVSFSIGLLKIPSETSVEGFV
jgi:hypothetical protein